MWEKSKNTKMSNLHWQRGDFHTSCGGWTVPCIRGWEVITHLVWLEVVILCCAKGQRDYCYYSEIILVQCAALNSLEVRIHTHTDEINCHQLIITLLLCLKKQNEVEVTHQQWARVCENSVSVCMRVWMGQWNRSFTWPVLPLCVSFCLYLCQTCSS